MRHRDEKYQRLHAEFRNTMESIAILLSLPTRFVEAHESTIKDRIREILSDNKDKSVVSSTILNHELITISTATIPYVLVWSFKR